MSANPSRNTLLDVLPSFSAEEEFTGVHVRPTISMPPYPQKQKPNAISNVVFALLAEAAAEEKLEDVTDCVEEEEIEEPNVVQASLPPPPKAEQQFAKPAAAPSEKRAPRVAPRLARMAASLTAIGFGIGFVFTSPPSPSPSMTTENASEVASLPSVIVEPAAAPGARAAEAPVAIAHPATPAAPKGAKAPSLADAESAMRAGQLARAEAAFQSVLAHGGADHEALTGLGKIAAAKQQTNDAMTFFERALARNPNYLPARLGLADVLWDSGRQDAAKAQYDEIRARYSPTIIPTRALDRTR